MRIFNSIVIALNTLIFFALGAFLVAMAFSGDLGRSMLVTYQEWYEGSLMTGMAPRAAVVVCGLALLAIAISTVWGNVQTRRRERAVEFHTPLGKVYIALGALEDFGRVVKDEIEGLKDIRLRVNAERKGLRVKATVVLWSDSNLPKITEEIQDAIRQHLHDIVGPEAEIRPLVIVSKVQYRDPEEWDDAAAARYPARIRRRPPV